MPELYKDQPVVLYDVPDGDGHIFKSGCIPDSFLGRPIPVTANYNIERVVGRAVLKSNQVGLYADLELLDSAAGLQPFAVAIGGSVKRGCLPVIEEMTHVGVTIVHLEKKTPMKREEGE